MDSRPEPDHRDGMYHQLTQAIAESRQEFETDYIKMRWFQNGNGHMTFKRRGLVDRINQIIAKRFPNALPAPRGSV